MSTGGSEFLKSIYLAKYLSEGFSPVEIMKFGFTKDVDVKMFLRNYFSNSGSISDIIGNVIYPYLSHDEFYQITSALNGNEVVLSFKHIWSNIRFRMLGAPSSSTFMLQ